MTPTTLALLNALIAHNVQFGTDEGADRAKDHVYYAEAAAAEVDDPQIDAALLLAVAKIESDYDPTATSRVVGGRRVTGSWPSTQATGRGPRFCGLLQTIAGDKWSTCLAQRDLAVGYLTGAREIKEWLEWAHGDLRAALRGHACGLYGLHHACKDYDGRVLRVRRMYSGPNERHPTS